MAIGTALAIGLGTAALGAGASVLGASAQKKAAGKAADVAQSTANQNNALTREIYGNNVGILSPYVNRGNAAGNAFNELLGLGAAAAPSAASAFDQYRNSTGYQFRVDEGNKAINQGYAARGQLESGAAMKALQARGQNLATDDFKDYLGLLGNQQGVGLSAGSALAGVGQQYAGTVSANNNMAGQAKGDAYIAGGVANQNMYSGITNAFGRLATSYR